MTFRRKGIPMRKVAALILIVAGVLALAYRGFDYTRKTHKADLGVAEFQFKERGHVAVPVWAGVLTVAAGTALLLWPGRKR